MDGDDMTDNTRTAATPIASGAAKVGVGFGRALADSHGVVTNPERFR